MDGIMGYLRELVVVLEHKKSNMSTVILDTMKQFHEEVKTQVKLTWDSGFSSFKGIDILGLFKKFSEYYEMIKGNLKSAEFLEGLKELSKIYVRFSWNNFEAMVLKVVEL
jgi:hypothetical protein